MTCSLFSPKGFSASPYISIKNAIFHLSKPLHFLKVFHTKSAKEYWGGKMQILVEMYGDAIPLGPNSKQPRSPMVLRFDYINMPPRISTPQINMVHPTRHSNLVAGALHLFLFSILDCWKNLCYIKQHELLRMPDTNNWQNCFFLHVKHKTFCLLTLNHSTPETDG
jgi:hypothetical protein